MPTVSAGTDQTVCAGGQVTLSGSGASTYSWDNGITDGSAFTPTATATYTVTATDGNGCTGTDQVDVTVNTLPTISAGADQAICAGDQVTIGTLSNLNNSLVAYYPFNGNSNDESGNSNDGVNNGASLTTDRFGNANSAYSFNGSSTINIPHHPNLSVSTTGEITVSAWSKSSQVSPGYFHILGKRGSSMEYQLAYNNDGTLGIGYGYWDHCGIAYPQNVWIHLVMVYNGNDWILYINGTQAHSFSDAVPTANLADLLIGGSSSYTKFIGDIDEVAVWSKALNSQEIQAIYNQAIYNGTAHSNYSYSWSPGGETTPSKIVQPSSTTTYTLTATDANNCSATDDVVITVNSPTVSAGADQSVCPGTSVTLSGSGASTYAWDNGVTDGSAFAANTTTTYTVTGTDASGCTATDQVVITVNALPTVSAGTDQTVCAGGQVTLSGSGASTYSWDNGITDGTAFTPTATATYTVTGTDANGCTATDNLTVTVIPLPTVDLGSDVSICPGSTQTLDAGSGPTNYLWSTGETTQTIDVSTSGTYTVTTGNGTPVSNSNSLSFDGTNDYVVINPMARNANSDLTICVFAKGQGSATCTKTPQYESYFTYDGSSVFYHLGILQTNGGNGWDVSSLGDLTTDFHFYTVTVDDLGNGSTSAEVFIDGVSMGQHIYPYSIPSYSLMEIGRNVVEQNQYYSGLVDNIQIWNTILTPSQIQQYMNSPPLGNELDLYGFWNFNEGTGITVSDLSSNGNNGAINGATWSNNVPYLNNCTAADTILVSLNTLPTVAVNDATICAGDLAATFTATSATATSWLWSGNGTGTNGTTTGTTAGAYSVVVTDANGCQSASASGNLTVNPLPTVSAGADQAVCDWWLCNFKWCWSIYL